MLLAGAAFWLFPPECYSETGELEGAHPLEHRVP